MSIIKKIKMDKNNKNVKKNNNNNNNKHYNHSVTFIKVILMRNIHFNKAANSADNLNNIRIASLF